ncbi:transposase domain-containing protein [Planomonospora sp. ID82291]|uniref:transposase domain-containing protein n=1 Tax=Planomonospora sp. ID82291 TaxID=2738136 RepID=UPI0018C41A7D|nr:transposase domain-containing protein [Planomonospora sp. ID82291]MBG0816094.1 transposase domain-containing protein [Planomonospora sp. ID82291]
MAEWIKLGGSGRLTDPVGLGALTSLVPRQVLDEAIERHGCRQERVRKLPAHVWLGRWRLMAGGCAPERLLTADRGFSDFRAWQYASSTGAALLWRLQAGLHPYRLEDLDDGSSSRRHHQARQAAPIAEGTAASRRPPWR